MIANGLDKDIEPMLKQAVALKPRDPLAQGFLTRFYLQTNNTTAAATQLESLDKVAPGQPSTVYLRAALHYLRRELPQARDLMQAVNKVMPDFAPANLLTAQIALDMNELAVAEQFAKLATTNAPHDPSGIEMLGAIYLKTGSPEKALATVKLYDLRPASMAPKLCITLTAGLNALREAQAVAPVPSTSSTVTDLAPPEA